MPLPEIVAARGLEKRAIDFNRVCGDDVRGSRIEKCL
jgi:hypothetical protein